MAVVLIVEDEDQVRVLAESYLQEHGHQTRPASTVPEALALLDSGELIDVLFTDNEAAPLVQERRWHKAAPVALGAIMPLSDLSISFDDPQRNLLTRRAAPTRMA